MRIGILTSGGDCQGLNGAMYGVVKTLKHNCREKLEIYGIMEGYTGLINADYKKMDPEEFEGILNEGGSILGNSRQPFKKINDYDKSGNTKVQSMINNYSEMKLDCIVVLGGNGSHKTANLLREKGLNVVTLPKTIDNDINGTEMTFGFQSAMDIATKTLEQLHTTAKTHKRIIVDEIMGNKAGWLTLYSGLAGEADIILIPEIPYSIDKIEQFINKKLKEGRRHIMIAAAEGIISQEEAKLSKKELKKKRKEENYTSAAKYLEKKLSGRVDREIRAVVPGHIQRGGSPNSFDKALTLQLGAKAAELILNKKYGRMVAVVNNIITSVPLSVAVEKPKRVSPNDEIVKQARMMGICLGD